MGTIEKASFYSEAWFGCRIKSTPIVVIISLGRSGGLRIGQSMTPPCAARQSDRLVQRGGDCGLESCAPPHALRPAFVFQHGDPDRIDPAHCVWPGAVPDRGAARLDHSSAGGRSVPDHSTLGRRARTVILSKRRRRNAGPLQLLVDSTGLKLNGEHEKPWGALQAAAAVARTPDSLAANPGYHFSKMPRRAPSRV
jgi:Transposase DDE domain